MTKCVQSNLEIYSAGQDSRIKNIEVQINRFISYTSYLNGHPTQLHHPEAESTANNSPELADVQINNPTKHVQESTKDFLPEELSNRVSEFLSGCNKFEGTQKMVTPNTLTSPLKYQALLKRSSMPQMRN